MKSAIAAAAKSAWYKYGECSEERGSKHDPAPTPGGPRTSILGKFLFWANSSQSSGRERDGAWIN